MRFPLAEVQARRWTKVDLSLSEVGGIGAVAYLTFVAMKLQFQNFQDKDGRD